MRSNILGPIILTLFAFSLSALATSPESHHFVVDHTEAVGYASYPGHIFSFPSYYGKLFLANTAQEVVYSSYPGYGSYPAYTSYPQYGSYPQYASYPSPIKIFEQRAQLACKFLNFSRARYASSQSAGAPANLITAGYDEYGEIYGATQLYLPSGDTPPTFIDTLECVP